MREINSLCKDIINLGDSNSQEINSVAFISLKRALQSYFSTYKSISLFGRTVLKDCSKEDFTRIPNRDYIEQYSETIVHFQHFFELVCKDILRKEHELLVLRIDNKHDVLYRLLQQENVAPSELEGIKTIDVGVAIDRLCTLIKENFLDTTYSFFAEVNNSHALKALNRLRNEIWHKGSFVMQYNSLDLFVGGYILPLVEKIINTPAYFENIPFWKYHKLSLEIDPISEIIQECNLNTPSIEKIAFLKELGRAAYNNPLPKNHSAFRNRVVGRAINSASYELFQPYELKDFVEKCPVCGVDSLVKYIHTETYEDNNGRNYNYSYVEYIKCQCCNFELHDGGMENLLKFGYELPNYWSVF
ncbi:hypothetical protein ACIP9C_15560 [Lysinibacillus sp. NPDC093210]|uniref:hypothetical protein n=1 Tax=Lysinibacillus sp. NPDC093210 TaxID=3364133 RepID=UPI00381116AE